MTVKLQVGKIPVGPKKMSLEPGATTSVTFDPFTVNGRNMRGIVSIGDDALAADNTFNFVVSPSQPLRVALLDRGAAGARRYIEDALSIGEMPRIDAVIRQPEGLTDDELHRSAVVIVHDVSIGRNTARRLHRFVEQGGGLFVAAGGRASWPTDVDLLPATLGAPVDRNKRRARAHRSRRVRARGVRAVPRSAQRQLLVLPGVRVPQRRAVQVRAGAGALRWGKPALLERRVGTGRVLLWASALDQPSSDLPINARVPGIRPAVDAIPGGVQRAAAVALRGAGTGSDVAGVQKRTPATRVVLTPSGAGAAAGRRRRCARAERAGVLRDAAAVGNATDVAVIASNVDPVEGDLTPMDPKDIALAALGAAPEAGGGGGRRYR